MRKKEWSDFNYEYCENLTELVGEWRATADAWERELKRGQMSASPVGGGRSNIHNWINWLRGCADAVERLK